MDDDELAYRAVLGRDPRFDGRFVTAVRTTGIYCRPSCPARTPLRRHVTFFATAAAARHAGYRACKRCRPDAAPDSPEWNLRADLAARAIALVRDGLVEREGVAGLARRLAYSPRQLQRVLRAELGVGPLELARSQRLDTARTLLESTDLPLGTIAFAAGFGSIRQFNDVARRFFGEPPSVLRGRTRRRVGAGPIPLELAYRPPIALDRLLEELGAQALPGIEHFDGERFARTLRLPRGHGTLVVAREQPKPSVLLVELSLSDLRDLPAAVARIRRILDLDADPSAIAEVLGRDRALAPLVAAQPGLRIPRAAEPGEALLRALCASPATRSELLAAAPLIDPGQRTEHLERLFPTHAELADVPVTLPAAGMAILEDLASGALVLEVGAARERAAAAVRERHDGARNASDRLLAAIWRTGFADPDAFSPPNRAQRSVLGGSGRAQAAARYDSWRPWRAYALAYLDQAAAAAGKAAA